MNDVPYATAREHKGNAAVFDEISDFSFRPLFFRDFFRRQISCGDGVADVLAAMQNHNIAWDSLTTPYAFDTGEARPLDRLKAGKIDDVMSAVLAATRRNAGSGANVRSRLPISMSADG